MAPLHSPLFQTSVANNLNSDLMKIKNWYFQWKMKFNRNPKK